jgi:hypothetical protein
MRLPLARLPSWTWTAGPCLLLVLAMSLTPSTTASADDDGSVSACVLAERANLPHGIAGDQRLVFIAEPLNGRVAVINRFTGQPLAELPVPPGGFLLPFELRVPHPGRLIVLDAGGFPSPTSPAIPRVYDYVYHFNPGQEEFDALLVRTVRFDGIPILFSEDVEVIDDERYVVSDSGFGGLWVIEADGSIVPGIVPASLNPQDAIPALAAGPFFPTVNSVGGVPFALPGNFAPGVGSLAADGGYLYFGSTRAGGLSRVPIAVFSDARLPHQRAADIQVVSPRPDPGDFDTLKGLTFNRWDASDGGLYATDPFHLRLIRIDVTTGQRTVVAADPLLFNFPVSAKFLPPVLGRPTIVVSSDQEHRFAALNAALGGVSVFQFPFLITEVRLPRGEDDSE